MATAMDDFTMSQLGTLRWADARRRVRAMVDGQTVVDAPAARLVWEPRRVVTSYAVPREAVLVPMVEPQHVTPIAGGPPVLTPDDPFGEHTADGTNWTLQAASRRLPGAGFEPADPDLAGWVVLDWKAFDAWFEEEQEAVGHPHDPFQRIDCLPTRRHIVVSLDGVTLAESLRPVLLLETHLPPRHYLPMADVRTEFLEPSDHTSVCAYKGRASYWSVRVGDRFVPDAVWTYREPLHDGEPVRDLVAFFDERFDVMVDGVVASQPRTSWS